MSNRISKKVFLIIVLIIVLFLGTLSISRHLENKKFILKEQTKENISFNSDKINVYFFWGNGCSHCKELIEYLNTIKSSHGKYFNLYTFEVWNNKDNAGLLVSLSNELDADINGIPCLIIGNEVIVGYSEKNADLINETILNEYKQNGYNDAYKKLKEN